MPRVPTYDSPQVAPTSMPNARIDAPVAPDIGIRQMDQLGNQLQRAGGQLYQIQNDANQVRVDDAVNKLREKQLQLTYDKDIGFSGQMGLSALQRKSGKSLTEDYDEAFQSQINEISSGLGNDQQRAAFSRKANEMRVSLSGQTTAHEAAQFREYSLSVREGTIKNRMNEISLRYADPAAVDESISSIKASVYEQGKLLGKSGEWVDAHTREITSKAHTVAIASALEKGQPDYAEKYLSRYSADMNGDDLLKASALVTKELDYRTGISVASSVMQSAQARMSTSGLDRAHNILLAAESGGKQFGEDGKTITSAKGALGIGQIMPATGPEAARLAGLEWDEKRLSTDEGYNRALSKAYFSDMLKKFGGNLPAAYAAYNAGPGAVATAMGEVEKLRDQEHGPVEKTFLDFLPRETQEYVAKNVKKYSDGGGSYSVPTIQEIHAKVREQLGPNASKERVRVAFDEADRLYSDFQKAQKQVEDQAVSNAMREMSRNGGRYSLLPPAVRDSIPAKELQSVLSFGERISKGDDVSSMALYQKLSTDQALLAGLSDDEFYRLRGELSESDFKHFSNERAKAKGAGSSDKFDDLNSASINSIVNNRLLGLGIDPTPKETKKADVERVAAIRKHINDSVLAEQKNRGARMSDAELSKFVDNIFLQTAMTRGGWFSADKRGRMMSMQASDIPSDIKTRLEADFESMGIEPTDSDLLEAYWKISGK